VGFKFIKSLIGIETSLTAKMPEKPPQRFKFIKSLIGIETLGIALLTTGGRIQIHQIPNRD